MTPSHGQGSHYWAGALSMALRLAADDLDTAGADSSSARRALREYEASDTHRPRVITGWAVMTAQGECYAIRGSYIDAEKARSDAHRYLYEAETCGHPAAAGWVASQLPISVEMISDEDRERLLEAGTPTLDREP